MSTNNSRDRRLMTAIRSAVGLALIVLAGSALTGAQSNEPLVRVTRVTRQAMTQELAWLGEHRFDIAFARFDSGLLIAQPGRAAVERSYLFVEDIGTFLSRKRLEPGYRLLPQTLTPRERLYDAVFVKTEGDGQIRDYALLDGSSPDDLEKKARKALGEGFVPVAINTDGRAAAVFERRLDGRAWKILATRSTATMEKELGSAASEGYRVMAAGGGRDLVYALAQFADAPAVTYRLLSATKAKTLERELNQMAGQGFHLVPSSLAALGGSPTLLNPRISNEAVVLVENVRTPASVDYRLVGAVRFSTIEKETLEAASHGYSIVTAIIGYEETLIILASPRAPVS